MEYQEHVPLSTLTTIRLGGLARYVVEVAEKDGLVAAVAFARERRIPWFVLGSGSNVVARGDYAGLIILNRIKGFEKLHEDEISVTYRIGAGEIWDAVVERLVDVDLSGVEAMSGIPGYAGSTLVQNVGAYGQEISSALVELEAYDTDSGSFTILAPDDCGFSYRNSVFKDPRTRHHIITTITLRLSKGALEPPFYPSLEQFLNDNAVTDYTPASIRAAVLAIRSDKLPDPQKIASAGSFFKNPVVDSDLAAGLLERYPNAPHWEMPGSQMKLAAGWLIEQVGLGSYSAHGLQLYPKNALVVTNLNAESAEDLERFKSEIIARVQKGFDITLEQEPEDL
ncbi:MAG: UDP-N-acetylmuramate dehydrogenase [Coriobacteriia bacterium]|nr:UDP-N-acetylmuramate dehydrogenase [Coriobacteriia bacterium]